MKLLLDLVIALVFVLAVIACSGSSESQPTFVFVPDPDPTNDPVVCTLEQRDLAGTCRRIPTTMGALEV